jgi:hypothetical protein
MRLLLHWQLLPLPLPRPVWPLMRGGVCGHTKAAKAAPAAARAVVRSGAA